MDQASLREQPERLFLRVDEVATKLGISPKVVREMLKSGDLRGIKLGGRWYVRRDYFDRLGSD